MLTAPVLEEERILTIPTERNVEHCTVCQSESAVAFPLTGHDCESFAGVNDEKAGFVTFSSSDLYSIYRGLRPF